MYLGTYHNTLRKVRFCNNHSPHLLQQRHQNRIGGGGLKRSPDITQGTVDTADVELVFDCKWDAV